MIADLINRFRPCKVVSADPGADGIYAVAMRESGSLLERMAEASRSSDPVPAILADIWRQRHNVPFTATIHETVQEMVSPLRGYTEAKPPEKLK